MYGDGRVLLVTLQGPNSSFAPISRTTTKRHAVMESCSSPASCQERATCCCIPGRRELQAFPQHLLLDLQLDIPARKDTIPVRTITFPLFHSSLRRPPEKPTVMARSTVGTVPGRGVTIDVRAFSDGPYLLLIVLPRPRVRQWNHEGMDRPARDHR